MKNLYEKIKYDPDNDYHQILFSEYLLKMDVINVEGLVTKKVLKSTASEIHQFEKEAIKRVEKQLNAERIRNLTYLKRIFS